MAKPPKNHRDIVQSVVDARDYHLVARTTRQIAEYLGLPEDDVEAALKAAPAMRRSSWTNLWGFTGGQDASKGPLPELTHKRVAAGKPAKAIPAPRMARKIDEPSIEGLLDDL